MHLVRVQNNHSKALPVLANFKVADLPLLVTITITLETPSKLHHITHYACCLNSARLHGMSMIRVPESAVSIEMTTYYNTFININLSFALAATTTGFQKQKGSFKKLN